MPGHKCFVCGNTLALEPRITFHRIPSNPETRAGWLRALGVQESDVKPSSRVCCRHFPDGDPLKTPSLALGKRFASPIMQGARSKQAKQRDEQRQSMDTSHTTTDDTPVTSPSSASTPVTSTPMAITPDPVPHQLLAAVVGEQLGTDYHVHELPSFESLDPQETLDSQSQLPDSERRIILKARIELLEGENAQLKAQAKDPEKKNFWN